MAASGSTSVVARRGQLEIADADGVADLEFGDVDLDAVRDVPRRGVDGEGEQLLGDDAVFAVHGLGLTDVSVIGTSTDMTSSRRTIWKSTWITL